MIQAPLSGALGWTLVHSLWQGIAIALVLSLSLCFLRAPRVRYAVAGASLLAIVAAFGVTLWQIVGLTSADSPPDSRIQTVQALATAQAFTSSQDSVSLLIPWLAPLWLVGVLVWSAIQVIGWLSARRLRHHGVCLPASRWVSRLTELRASLGISRPVMLLESSLARVPVVFGWLRPVIVFPVGMLTAMPVSQVEAILLHELAHVRRHDYLANLVQMFVETLFFYHPAAWWISSVIRRERENCCDDLVIAIQSDRIDYARALVALEQERGYLPLPAANGGDLRQRIERLLRPRASSMSRMSALPVALLALAGAATMLGWQVVSPGDSPWQRWISEDVALIARPDEKAAFQRLLTDAEREGFITQFWQRRDPTPGTPVNEMKEEHYRRIAYSNQRFAAGNKPGWQTDRGRIYILYGPPDEMESHPGAPPQTPATQAWHYRLIAGIGNNVIIEFVDAGGTGDFRQTLDPRR